MGFWKRLGILVTGYDAEAQRREQAALVAAFQALPKPKDAIPSTVRNVTKW